MREYEISVNEAQAKRVALDIARDDVSIPWLVKLIDVAFDNVIRQEDAFDALNRMFGRRGYKLAVSPLIERPAKAVKTIDEETLGARIRRLRKANGWSQTTLSDHCGWGSQIRISNYEKGTREPSLDDLRVLADALGTNLAELTDVASTKEPATTEKTFLGRKHPVVDQPGKLSKTSGLGARRFAEQGEDDDLPSARELQRARKYPPVAETGPQVLAIIQFHSIKPDVLQKSFEVTPEEYERIRDYQWADFGLRWMQELLTDLTSTYKQVKVAKPVYAQKPEAMTRSQLVAELEAAMEFNNWLTKDELVQNFEFGEDEVEWIKTRNHTKFNVTELRMHVHNIRAAIAERAIEVSGE